MQSVRRILNILNSQSLTEEELRDFRRRRFPADRRTLVHIGRFGVVTGLAFFVLDMFRYTDVNMAFWRLGFVFCSLLISHLGARCKTRLQLSAAAFSFAIVLFAIATAQDFFVDDISPMFYSNFLLVPIFLLMFYPGFLMRTSLIGVLIILGTYLFYSIRQYPSNEIHLMQFFNSSMLAIGMAFAGFILRKRFIAEYRRQMKYRDLSRELTEANQIKDRLLSVLSHDVKSPLLSLKQVLSILKTGDLDKEEETRLFSMLEERVSITGDFVNNTIHWVKNQMDGMDVNPEQLDLRDLVFECLELYGTSIAEKDININTDNLGLHSVTADREMTKIALRNLLNNAIKFSPEGEEITIEAKKTNGGVRCRITDRGPGISAENIQKIFRFQPGDSHHAGGEYATGIGLVLTHDFMLRNGGDVRVNSDPALKCTFFEVDFPDAVHAPA